MSSERFRIKYQDYKYKWTEEEEPRFWKIASWGRLYGTTDFEKGFQEPYLL